MEQLGPYRIIERIGAGGGGEVHLAEDTRLNRQVAVKHIHGRNLDDRKRFEREARLMAQLSHPNIVAVHDLITEDQQDHLIMEYVPGRNLAKRIAEDGPLPTEALLILAREVTRGLAAAHRQGVIHRDLKTENVLLNAQGRAKLVDFGLARTFDESTVTAVGSVVGTYRTMSPEQASGAELDLRTDLFSLGVLLYEAATGASPFKGATPLETMRRITEETPVPPETLRPDLPKPLIDLIPRLLEKDPALRPVDALAVLSFLDRRVDTIEETTAIQKPAPSKAKNKWPRYMSLLLILAALIYFPLHFHILNRSETQTFVAVPPTQIQGQVGLLDFAVQSAVVEGLHLIRKVQPVASNLVTPFNDADISAIAHGVDADELLTSNIRCEGLACAVILKRVKPNGQIAWQKTVKVDMDQARLLHDTVVLAVTKGFNHQVEEKLDIGDVDYQIFMELKRDAFSNAKAPEELYQDVQALRRRAPNFPEIALLENRLAHQLFRTTRDADYLKTAADLAKDLQRRYPHDPRPAFMAFELALTAGELIQAQDLLSLLEAKNPANPGIQERRARLLERQGEAVQALALMQEHVARRPHWRNFYNLGQIAFRQGEGDIAVSAFEATLDRFPDYQRARNMLATTELLYGDPIQAQGLFAQMAENTPSFNVWNNLGIAHLLLRQHEQARDAFQKAHDLRPDNPYALLNLADALELTGQRPRALDHYRRVIELIDQDVAASVQNKTVKAQALAHLGEAAQAVATIQSALQEAPQDAQTAFEAALVYTLTGERTSALVQIDRALDMGYQPRWFQLAWFDQLRDNPSFIDLFQIPQQ